MKGQTTVGRQLQMLEKLFLACTVTLSLYFFVQLGATSTNPSFLGETQTDAQHFIARSSLNLEH